MSVSDGTTTGCPSTVATRKKVVGVSDKDMQLEFTTRRYAVGRDVNGAALGSQQPLSLTEMSSNSQGTTTIALGAAIPSALVADASLRARLSAPESPDPRALQAGSRYQFSSP